MDPPDWEQVGKGVYSHENHTASIRRQAFCKIILTTHKTCVARMTSLQHIPCVLETNCNALIFEKNIIL
jgi:hypothetical protein